MEGKSPNEALLHRETRAEADLDRRAIVCENRNLRWNFLLRLPTGREGEGGGRRGPPRVMNRGKGPVLVIIVTSVSRAIIRRITVLITVTLLPATNYRAWFIHSAAIPILRGSIIQTLNRILRQLISALVTWDTRDARSLSRIKLTRIAFLEIYRRNVVSRLHDRNERVR